MNSIYIYIYIYIYIVICDIYIYILEDIYIYMIRILSFMRFGGDSVALSSVSYAKAYLELSEFRAQAPESRS